MALIQPHRPKDESYGDIGILNLDGVRVHVYRYAESGQVFVSVNTEDAKFDNTEDGNPTLFVELNDAVLYDGDPDPETRVEPRGL